MNGARYLSFELRTAFKKYSGSVQLFYSIVGGNAVIKKTLQIHSRKNTNIR